MGLFEDLFGKHKHHKDPIVKELLEIIKKQQQEAIIAEQNERKLLEANRTLQRELYRCMNKKPHGARYDVVF